MDIQTAINTVINHNDLPGAAMQSVMQSIMTGACTDAQIAGFLVALRMKGESVDEISAAARVMRELSAHVNVDKAHLVDTCGTGGDGANTFNISTTSAFVAAAGGARVAKHGNRSVSSKSGSADLLEAAGMRLDLSPEQVGECIDKAGIGFMFAPMHHSAMKHAIGPRKELGTRTLFNLLGPLTNPAGAPNQVLGVFAGHWQQPLAEVLQQLGSEHVLVVHSGDGMDEISLSAGTRICELKDGAIETYSIQPEDFNLETASQDMIAVDSVDTSLATMQSVLDDEAGPARDIVCMNAGAALYAANVAADLKAGVTLAGEVIASGKARKKLEALISVSQSF
ncbi:MAG: anthranilate phosphoribosyltransferase [Thiotrichales bacterium]|nr:anthranilate phosphoribosyltransferase [Thiotrichales bacterium]